jgi:hypothetical protein
MAFSAATNGQNSFPMLIASPSTPILPLLQPPILRRHVHLCHDALWLVGRFGEHVHGGLRDDYRQTVAHVKMRTHGHPLSSHGRQAAPAQETSPQAFRRPSHGPRPLSAMRANDAPPFLYPHWCSSNATWVVVHCCDRVAMTATPSVGNGWANAADTAGLMVNIAGCNYLDPWIGSANPPVPLCSAETAKRGSEADWDDVPAPLITPPPA